MRKLGRTTRKLDKVRMLIHEIAQKLYPFLYDNTHVLINISGILSRQCLYILITGMLLYLSITSAPSAICALGRAWTCNARGPEVEIHRGHCIFRRKNYMLYSYIEAQQQTSTAMIFTLKSNKKDWLLKKHCTQVKYIC